MDAIYAFGLSKQYGNRTALYNMTLRISEGEKFALTGLADCGKTTALRLFAALELPSVGNCSVFGFSTQYEPEKIHRLAGVVTGTSNLYDSMTVTENLQFFANLYNLDSYDTVDRISFLLHKLDIWETRDKVVREIPTHAFQRVHLARALIHSPRLLLVDEPAQGMDLETIDVVNGLIEHINSQENVTVLISTRHFLHAQKFCDRYAVMSAGAVSAVGDLETLRTRAGLFYNARFFLTAGSKKPPEEFLQDADGSWSFKIKSEEEMPRLLVRLVNADCEVLSAVIEKPTLTDVYERLCRYGVKGSEFFVRDVSEQGQPETNGGENLKGEKNDKDFSRQKSAYKNEGSSEENKNMVLSGECNSEEGRNTNMEL